MPEPVPEAIFERLADRTLCALEAALNDIEGVEADVESGILTIEFLDGVRFVVNSHRAARQIWLAALGHAWHFDLDEERERWTATKTGEELWSLIESEVGGKLGMRVRLKGASTTPPA
jgi:CyaY protein